MNLSKSETVLMIHTIKGAKTMNQQHTPHNEESLFPVFRFDLENRLIYANAPALPLMKYWHCRINEKIPGEVISMYPELFHAALSHRPTDLTVEFKSHLIKFSIVPFPEAKYIGMYAYSMEQNENFVSRQVPAQVFEPVTAFKR